MTDPLEPVQVQERFGVRTIATVPCTAITVTLTQRHTVRDAECRREIRVS